MEPKSLNGERKFVLAGLAAMIVILLVASTLKKDLGLPSCLAALAITATVSVKSKSNPLKLAREISWGTLALVACLFIMVDAVESIGALRLTSSWLAWAQHLPSAAGALVTGFAVAVANNLVNNLPLGLIAGGTLQAAHVKGLLANAVLIGVDLGPNLSITGSLATILWLLALRKKKLSRRGLARRSSEDAFYSRPFHCSSAPSRPGSGLAAPLRSLAHDPAACSPRWPCG